jgi:hypothetical protein
MELERGHQNETWSEMDRTCTKKSSENYFLDRITDRKTETVDPVKKWSELRTIILKITDHNY